MKHRWFPRLALSLVAVFALARAEDPPADVAEPGSAEEIARATTEPQFLSPWVASLPASALVPSPRVKTQRGERLPGSAYSVCASAEAASSSR